MNCISSSLYTGSSLAKAGMNSDASRGFLCSYGRERQTDINTGVVVEPPDDTGSLEKVRSSHHLIRLWTIRVGSIWEVGDEHHHVHGCALIQEVL